MMKRKQGGFRLDSRLSMALVWLCSGFVVAGVHAAVLTWMMSAPATDSGGAAALAVMVELSFEPATENGDERVTTEGAALSGVEPEGDRADEAVSDSGPEPERLSPPPEEPMPEEAVETEVPEPEQSAVSLPVPPTKPEIRPVVRRREVPEKTAPVPADEPARMRTEARVPASEQRASSPPLGGRSDPSAESIRWSTRLMAHLERRKRYPSGARARREAGTVFVRFLIDGSGNVLSVSLEKTSGYSELDDEVLSLVRRASPVPAPPADAGRNIVVPVRFTLR